MSDIKERKEVFLKYLLEVLEKDLDIKMERIESAGKIPYYCYSGDKYNTFRLAINNHNVNFYEHRGYVFIRLHHVLFTGAPIIETCDLNRKYVLDMLIGRHQSGTLEYDETLILEGNLPNPKELYRKIKIDSIKKLI